MIKSCEYVRRVSGLGDEGRESSVLRVKYRFEMEVAPKDRKDVRRRVNPDGEEFRDYLSVKEGMCWNSKGGFFGRGGSVKLTVKRSWFDLMGLNFTVSSSEVGIPREDLFDINSFNDYVLGRAEEGSSGSVARVGAA